MTNAPGFESCFNALTGHAPMRWQTRLFRRMLAGDLPAICDLPTGLGKTSVIPIWLIALASGSRDSCKSPLPRRLVYIVNRRTVVDQATGIVEIMRLRLRDSQDKALVSLKERLKALAASTDEDVVGISALRGELADNEEWKADPARPAIVVGTIDMVGSKLLFSGYGDGRYLRAHHAGLIGQDALIVHDEAHLTPAFSDFLRTVAMEQGREVERNGRRDAFGRPIRVIELSATSRDGKDNAFTLEPEDQEDQIVQSRLTAEKRLFLHPAQDDRILEEILAQSVVHESANARVLIYVRSPEQAQQIARGLQEKLGKGGRERIALLTGTIRGHERDQLMRQPPANTAARVIRHFLDGTKPERSVYLISTSAGEVGIDLDADHLVCDVTTLDSMIQRLGRVNRRGGEDRRACVDVVGGAPVKDQPSEFDKAIAATFSILKQWEKQRTGGIDVSPGNLRRLVAALDAEERKKAFSPKPETVPLTDILLDGWSLTSVQEMPGRPEVAEFLHGLTKETEETRETFVAWRREVDLLEKAGVDESELRDWFRACRVEPHERLRDQTQRVKNVLESLLKKHRQTNQGADFAVVVIDERGGARRAQLSEVVKDDFRLAFKTVVLPVGAGGLNEKGMLDSNAVSPSEGIALDVAEVRPDERQRLLCRTSADSVRYEWLDNGGALDAPPSGLREKARIALTELGEGEETGESLDLVLFVSPRRSALEDPETASARQTLKEHSCAIADQMSAIAEQLHLPDAIREALVTAARWHDKGKDRPVWQRYARNDGGAEPVAKAVRYLHPRALGGYRHEFGSLLDATKDVDIERHSERDLIIHLIAAHHGWARPHFEPRAYDHDRFNTQDNEEAAIHVVRRFERLQQRFGRWGLAWLESLLRCADIAASKAAVGKAVSAQESQEIPV